ncbi:hypothetical protein [Mycobacterium sp. AZCC_0083]|nr:hypothetical protein [Mycobacterium sp. AZCC_0083]MBB5168237.1 hypothetical protein [Mycobacterium sp. AZCC_0083]
MIRLRRGHRQAGNTLVWGGSNTGLMKVARVDADALAHLEAVV